MMKDKDIRFLIGTLYCGENEYSECITSIEKQNYKEFAHVVFSNLPNREAHNTLYNHFMQKSEEFDVFIKIDADMIIEDINFLKKLNIYLNNNKEISRLIIPVYDFYSDSQILGVNIYRNYVKWDTNMIEHYFVDRIQIPSTIKVCITEYDYFKNAISHCKNPNLHQTYMYGFHRTLKAYQPDKFLPTLAPYNWKKFHYIYHKKLGNSVYKHVYIGIYNALTKSSSVNNNSYNLQNINSYSQNKIPSVLSYLFKLFHPYISYSLVYFFVRLNFSLNYVFRRNLLQK